MRARQGLSKILLSATVAAFLSVPALAEETTAPTSELKANLRRLGFEYSKTDVSHAKEYENSPVSQFNADSQSLIKGVLDFALEYNQVMSMTKSKVLKYDQVLFDSRNQMCKKIYTNLKGLLGL